MPVEVPVFASLTEALASGRLHRAPASASCESFVVGPDLPDDTAAMFERNDHGECVFFERESRLCIVHRDLGETALPTTCRHFPRVAVRDGRGTSIGLSHYCPTAASMLFREDIALAIVDAPPAFPAADYEGLIVTDEDLPPLLRPGVVMDLPAYDAWEVHMVRRCAAAATPESAIATLDRDAARVRAWTPEGPSMPELVAELPGEMIDALAPGDLERSLDAYTRALAAVPEELRAPPDEDGLDAAYSGFVAPHWATWSAPLIRYVAAKAFASWTAYQGHGLLSIVRGLDVALALVRVEASRQCRDAARSLDQPLLLAAVQRADFLLNHQAVGEDLALEWSQAETP